MDKVTKLFIDKAKTDVAAVYSIAAQSIATDSTTIINMDKEECNTNKDLFTVDLANNKILINKKGKYLVYGNAAFTGNISGTYRQLELEVSGIDVSNRFPSDLKHPVQQLGFSLDLSAFGIFDIAKDSYIRLKVRHDVGSSLNTTSYVSNMGILKIN